MRAIVKSASLHFSAANWRKYKKCDIFADSIFKHQRRKKTIWHPKFSWSPRGPREISFYWKSWKTLDSFPVNLQNAWILVNSDVILFLTSRRYRVSITLLVCMYVYIYIYIYIYIPINFRHVRIISKSAYYICHFRLSVCLPLHLSACNRAAPTGRISMKFDIDNFHYNWLTNSKFG